MALAMLNCWTKGPDEAPLYSDWKVSFVTDQSSSHVYPSKDETEQDAGSVSTSSMTSSSDDSVVSSSTDDELSMPSSSSSREAYFSIHRNMIGPKSVFFTESFLGPADGSSVISLPSGLPPHAFDSVVEAFEVFLEHCYSAGDFAIQERLTTEIAVAMFCLCNYLGMDSDVCEEVRTFIKTDLNQDTAAAYYQIVKDLQSSQQLGENRENNKSSIRPLLDARPIMEMVVILCHHNPNTLSPSSELSKIADLKLWESVGSLLADDESPEHSKVWSENLVHFFDTQGGGMNAFCSLTSESILPEISKEVALRLLEHERKHGLSTTTTEDNDDQTVDTLSDSDTEEEEEEQEALITNLQQRCIKALCDSNWAGDENEVEDKRGKLTKITTPSVLEALLIESVTGERALASKIQDMESTVQAEKKLRVHDQEMSEYHQQQLKFEIAKERQKQQCIKKELDEEIKKREAVEMKLKSWEAKMAGEKEEWRKATALLQANLEKEKKKSYSTELRYKAIENARTKSESDREMFEMTVKEAVQRLDSVTNTDDWYYSCGMAPLIMALTTMNDHRECSKIKAMLQEVLNDPSAYERDYLLDNLTFQTMSNLDDEDEEESKV